ncbi:hypothetical protein LOC67_16860 [Stieleria sp. JC731]|uniref:hypothetical protein n=1 Tax=Stieleria sp. JC731 TaxID=2894195 RepID=UPI001E3A8DFD|nr:hypothetical protein [Stieleria sp. JC731]MCC9602228.1 hypothetical protein [Stieleria sp. JC731]
MVQVHTWCKVCQSITVVELLDRLQSDSDFSLEMQEFYRSQIADPSKSEEERVQLRELIAESKRYNARYTDFMNELRGVRVLPQRCLRCDNTDLEIPDTDHGSFGHHPCPGVLSAPFTIGGGVLDPRFYDIPHLYDPDGVLLREGTSITPCSSDPLPLWSASVDCKKQSPTNQTMHPRRGIKENEVEDQTPRLGDC